MARDQRIALETLEELGALQNQDDLDQWASDYNEIIDGVGDILSELGAPGTDYGAVLAKGSLVAIAAGAKIGSSRHIPGSPSHDADATKKWLQGKGKGAVEKKVTDPKQAERVYKEMERYTQGNKEGPTAGMRDDLAKAKAACAAAEQKYKDAKEAAGK